MHFDAFALAGAVAARTRRVTVTTGPLALGLRDPVGVAMGVASVAVIGDRAARLALGASSPTVVQRWHGREFGGEAERVDEAISVIRSGLDWHQDQSLRRPLSLDRASGPDSVPRRLM